MGADAGRGASLSKSSTSPTARTLQWLRGRDVLAQVVEKWNPYARIRQDLFGIIDIVACAGMGGIQGWQATSIPHIRDHIDKALAEKRLHSWLAAGGKFYIIGWGQMGAAGTRKLWKHRIVEVRLYGGELTAVEEQESAS